MRAGWPGEGDCAQAGASASGGRSHARRLSLQAKVDATKEALSRLGTQNAFLRQQLLQQRLERGVAPRSSATSDAAVYYIIVSETKETRQHNKTAISPLRAQLTFHH